MSPRLLQAARDTLVALLVDAKYLGAQPGMSAALHPWSQPRLLPPHGHWLGAGGGLPSAGQWVAVRHGLLLPPRVVMAVLRGKRRGALRRAFAQDALGLPEAMRPQQLPTLMNRLGHARKTLWNVHRWERSGHGVGVVPSLARPLRDGPLQNARLMAWDGDRVTVRIARALHRRRREPPHRRV